MVTPLPFISAAGDDAALIQALGAAHPGAAAAFYDRHATHVYRALQSVLGPDGDLPDLLQKVFIRAICRTGELRDLGRARPWLTRIAVFTARAHLRRRALRSWLGRLSPARAVARQQEPAPSDARRALRVIDSVLYPLLDRLPADERVAFALHVIEGLSLPQGAEACRVSLATFKRRLARAERKFVDRARAHPALEQWLATGTRWSLGSGS